LLPSSLEDWFAHRPINVDNYNKLLRVHSAKHDLDAGLKAFAHMRAAGLVPNRLTYHALISLYGSRPSPSADENKKNADSALAILHDDLVTVDLTPDVYTYGCLISTLGKLGDHKRAFELLPHMIKQGVIPNTVIRMRQPTNDRSILICCMVL
jgi:pentatricopeptide repeat protein